MRRTQTQESKNYATSKINFYKVDSKGRSQKLIEENPSYKDMVLIEIESCQAETMRESIIAEGNKYADRVEKGFSFEEPFVIIK